MYYTKKKVQNAKDLFTSLFTGFRPPCPFNGPLRVQMVMTFPWRKSEPKANRARGWVPMPVKPDWDNLPKVPFDVMSNLSFWCDDGQIFDGRVIKGWGETPGVRVSITEVGENEKYSEFFENDVSHRQEADSIVLCPVCQRGDVWQEAVNRAIYVYKGESVEDGQEVVDYLLAEVAALLETQNATCEPRGLLRSAQPDCSPHSKIGRIFEAEKSLSQAIVEMCEHETELPTSAREKIGHAACLLSNYCVLNADAHCSTGAGTTEKDEL